MKRTIVIALVAFVVGVFVGGLKTLADFRDMVIEGNEEGIGEVLSSVTGYNVSVEVTEE